MSISKQLIQTWRQGLSLEQKKLEHYFFKQKNPDSLLSKQSKLIDKLLFEVWSKANIQKEVCLIAVGGYGRGQLFPYSDIDLLILVPEMINDDQNKSIETLIGTLWDIGLHVGHSVRTLQECIDETQQDVTTQTNLLEARLLIGSQATYRDFLTSIHSVLNPHQFLVEKMREQDNRHVKFNDTANNLEPNIKESPGGLRDLNMILWLAESQKLGNTWQALASNGVINKQELQNIRRHERHLKMLRIRMHYLAKRREDRLLFDFQNDLAKDLGLVNTIRKRASEQLMQGYYRSARYINLINEILIKLLTQKLAPSQPPIKLNDQFVLQHNMIETASEHVFKHNPSAILECFLLLQQHRELEGFGPHLLRQLQFAKKLITAEFRQLKTNRQLFLKILMQPKSVNYSLSRMNRYGILGKYIPAFGRIIGQMQHDLFHVYTVDEHILNVLCNLRRFAYPDLKHEFPLCTELFSTFNKPHLLYLAALFHDIAKGRGGDHSELGCVDAKRFCKLHELSKEDTNLVSWLVEAHLAMSKTAQKSDLTDPKIIENFAKFVGNEFNLTALYLLTVADIRGTSPLVWNAWKARLLESLFLQTRNVLRDPYFSVKHAIEIRQKEASEKLTRYGLKQTSYETLWRELGSAYFMRYSSEEIAWHSRLLTPHVHTKKPIVRARLSPDGDGITVMIFMPYQDDIFARICSFFDAIAYNIAQARVYTSKHEYALNTFTALDNSSKSISYNGLLKYIETNLFEKLQANMPLDKPIQGRIARQVKYMSINTQLNLTANIGSIYHTLDLVSSDRPSLLANIAHIFFKNGVELISAKINTLGNRVEDTFLISGKNYQALTQVQIDTIQQEILSI